MDVLALLMTRLLLLCRISRCESGVSSCVAGDYCIACLEDLGSMGNGAANIHDGSTPGGKVIIRCITPDPVTSCNC